MLMDTTSNSSEVEQPPSAALVILLSYHATRFVLLVPLSIFILYQAFQQWRRQRSFSTTSHSDIFTFHITVMEIFSAFGTGIYLWHYYLNVKWTRSVGVYLISISYLGQGFFHILTCVERYLAVVHPVTYRGLKSSWGVRIRDFTIACVWLVCFVIGYVIILGDDTADLVSFLIPSGLSLVINSFCSVSVLCVLIRPKPGEGGRGRERIDQSKLRAFCTIMAILGALWVWIVPFIVSSAVLRKIQISSTAGALVFWFNLPSSLVLPLLYLHRTGRLAGCRGNGET